MGSVDIDMSDLLSECSDSGYMSEIDDEVRSINIDISNGPPIDIKNFKIVHYNINSILAPGKIGQLSDISNESSKANRRVKTAYCNTINSLLHNSSISAKKKFGILLKLMKNDKISNMPPLVENDMTINDSLEKSNILNGFFASKSSVKNYKESAPQLEPLENISLLGSVNTSPIEIGKFIRNIKKSFQSHCGISGKFLSFISTPISFSMSRLFNNLFEIGHFPTIWKIAHITPIYKKSGPKTCKTSYRPISLLPTLSKIFESVLHDRLFRHCIENNIITEKQAAYLKGDSTVSQLL